MDNEALKIGDSFQNDTVEFSRQKCQCKTAYVIASEIALLFTLGW